VDDLSFARQFRMRRLAVRACFLFGLALVTASKAWPEPFLGATVRGVALALGLALLGMTFPLYYRYANRCPKCRQSFSEVREYAGEETRRPAIVQQDPHLSELRPRVLTSNF
jgi:uncharacterized membrane protein YccC